jgi:hypothetical protein
MSGNDALDGEGVSRVDEEGESRIDREGESRERAMVASTEKWSLREQPSVGWGSVMPTWAVSTSHVGSADFVPFPMKM